MSRYPLIEVLGVKASASTTRDGQTRKVPVGGATQSTDRRISCPHR